MPDAEFFEFEDSQDSSTYHFELILFFINTNANGLHFYKYFC